MSSPGGDELVAQLFERRQALGKLPGWKIRVDLLALDRSTRIFSGNAAELTRHFEAHEASGTILRLSGQTNPEGLEEFLNEVDRLLHNYLAAAMSLRDHSRRIRNRRLGPSSVDNLAADYEARKQTAFAESALAQFVEDLRNFSLHRRVPISQRRMQWTEDEGLASSVVLPTSELLRWKKWSPLGRRFITESGDDIVLDEVATSYTETILEFHGWFRQALRWRHREAIRDLQDEEEAIAEAFSTLTGEPVTRRDNARPDAGLGYPPRLSCATHSSTAEASTASSCRASSAIWDNASLSIGCHPSV